MFSLSSLFPPTLPALPTLPLSSPTSIPSVLAILGPHPPSSPICLALSSHSSPALILSCAPPAKLVNALELENERWLRDSAGRGGVVGRLRGVEMRFPPTPSHLRLLLYTLHIGPRPSSDPTELERPPGLLILHDLSSYFSSSTHTLDEYTSLIALAQSTLARLHSSPSDDNDPNPTARLIILDSSPTLSLPLHRPPSSSASPQPHARKRPKPSAPEQRRAVHEALRHFADWTLTFTRLAPTPPPSPTFSQPDEETADEDEGDGGATHELRAEPGREREGEGRDVCVRMRWTRGEADEFTGRRAGKWEVVSLLDGVGEGEADGGV